MTLDKILDTLQIDSDRVKFDNDKYTIYLKDSDEYARIYTLLDNMKDIAIDGEATTMDIDDVTLKYETDLIKEDITGELVGYTITLAGDLDTNSYKLEIEEK